MNHGQRSGDGKLGTKIHAHFLSAKHDWETPTNLYHWADATYGPIDLDAAANPANAKADVYLSETDDALTSSWGSGIAWCNPPYANMMPKFVQRAWDEVSNGDLERAILLIPCRTETKIFQDVVFPNACEVYFLGKRIKFVGANDYAPFPACIVIFDKHKSGPAKLEFGRDWDTFGRDE